MPTWLGFGAVNQALLWGSLLVASPIIIHLLSKRRFRTVDWAAMDYLLEAERRNRRRIRLEHLILLLLRCLAVLLLTFLVARLFVRPAGLAARAVDAARVERVVLLDDSPSMDARRGSKTVFDEAKRLLAELVRQTARERPGDTLTLVLTSQPGRPVLNGQYLTGGKADATVGLIESLRVSDRSAGFDSALLAIDEMLAKPAGHLNRVVTVLTDLRRRDWLRAAADGERAAGPGSRNAVARVLERVAENAQGVGVVDLGGEWDDNLTVSDVVLREKALVVDVPARIEVVVTNHGEADASAVAVTFTAGASVPLRGTLDLVRAGESAAIPFTYTFRQTGSVPVRAEVAPDVLRRDNVRHYAASVRKGVPILLVDGEPSSQYGETETFYLERALDPPGDTTSGNDVRVVTENQFESLALDGYQVVVLANLYRITEGRRTSLEQWVRGGGGLVVFLGDQVDELAYNERLHAAGQGLLPVTLSAVQGDEAGRTWVHLSHTGATHPVLRVFEGAQNPFLRRVKFFRWWEAAVSKDALASGTTRVVATFDDPQGSPAIVEHAVGEGRVLVVTTTADAEWTSWPADPSYLVAVLELARYMTRPMARAGSLGVGQPIRRTLDPSRYDSEVRVQQPGSGDSLTLQALPTEDGKSLRLLYDDTTKSGLYRLHLARRDGRTDVEHVAVNVDASEGDLRPAGRRAVRRLLADGDVAVMGGSDFLRQEAAGAKLEIWRGLLIALLVVLCAEQGLAWLFGTRR